jgi:hypothetical protein
VENQHLAMWLILNNTQRQAHNPILGANPTAKIRLLSFNSTQSKVVTGLLTGHNILRRQLHLMGLIHIRLCRCGADDEISAFVVWECDALASLRRTYLGFIFLDPEDFN